MAVNFEFKAFKKGFFDRAAIESQLSKQERARLSKIGAFIRRRAKSSIRKRKKPSPPGKPPSSHTGVLKDFIFFAYDSERRSVVVGPTKTNQRNAFAIASAGRVKTIPGVLEFGGQVGMHEVFLRNRHTGGGEWVRLNFRARQGSYRSAFDSQGKPRPTRIRKASYPPRPFIGPVGRAEAGRFREIMRALVR